jgi:hypothetical protein
MNLLVRTPDCSTEHDGVMYQGGTRDLATFARTPLVFICVPFAS